MNNLIKQLRNEGTENALLTARAADEIERLTANETALLKTIETIQIIRMAEEAHIAKLEAALQQAYVDGGCREDEAAEMVEALESK